MQMWMQKTHWEEWWQWVVFISKPLKEDLVLAGTFSCPFSPCKWLIEGAGCQTGFRLKECVMAEGILMICFSSIFPLIITENQATAAADRLQGWTLLEAKPAVSGRVQNYCIPIPSDAVWHWGKKNLGEMITCIWVLPTACLAHCTLWAFPALLQDLQPMMGCSLIPNS